MSAMWAQREGQEQGSGAQCNKGGRTGSRGRSGLAFGLVVGYSVMVVVLAALVGWCEPTGACGGAAVGKFGWEGGGVIEERARLKTAVAEAVAERMRKMGAVVKVYQGHAVYCENSSLRQRRRKKLILMILIH